jgi:hypothetical protein
MTSKIERLTPEQEALLPEYRDKWRKIALSTEPIDRQQATEAIKALCCNWQTKTRRSAFL